MQQAGWHNIGIDEALQRLRMLATGLTAGDAQDLLDFIFLPGMPPRTPSL